MDDSRLNDLLLDWEERFDKGQDMSAEDLCRDCPHLGAELARRIAVIRKVARLAAPAISPAGSDPSTRWNGSRRR